MGSNVISENGISYGKGISFSKSGGEVKIKLGGEYSTFHSIIGIDDEVDPDEGSAYFYVKCTYMDGTSETLYSSYRMYASSRSVTLDLSMENVDVLTLQVVRGNYGHDYGCFADAYIVRKDVPADPPNVTYVSDMDWSKPLYVYRNATAFDTEPSIGGIARSKGISFMKNACSITVDLNGEYATFVSDIGVDDITPHTFSAEMRFSVYGDDVLLYQSNWLKACDPVETINVDVTGVQQMRLVVSCSSYNNYTYEAYGSWSGAYVMPPVLDAPPTDDPTLDDPFYGGTPGGEIVGEVNPDPALDSMQYAGEYYDAETGLIYLRNRYYDPSARRFTQEDPARDEWNWYAYCGDNPVNYIDLLGTNRSNKIEVSGSPCSFWQDYNKLPKNHKSSINCYAFAMGWVVNPITGKIFRSFFWPRGAQPGMLVGNMQSTFNSSTKNRIIELVQKDVIAAGMIFGKLEDPNAKIQTGTWKIAIAIDADGTGDYHFYRQNNDGTWSHKPGASNVKNTDESGNLIYNPKTADRGIYECFVGFYYVGYEIRENWYE